MPQGILDAIRKYGERSNADQVSPAGARSVYQFIPATRKAFMEKYGVDPWKDAESATQAAALHLRESQQRTGSWDKAVAGYHGGIKAERGVRGPQNRAYTKRVGSFDGEQEMAQSLYPVPYYGGLDPLAPEPMKETAPVVPNDLGPSTPVPAAAPQAAKKRGGLLGALESVFMPDPESRWAAALRGGLFDAKANQAAYKAGVEKQGIDTAMAEAKLKALLTKGEYQVVGNNVFHTPADGSEPRLITPPATVGEKERLLDKWTAMQDGDPAKELIERMLAGANADPVLESRERVAGTRADATKEAARIRSVAKPTPSGVKLPSGAVIVE